MSKVLPAMLLVLVFQQSTYLGDSLGPKKYLMLEAKKKQTPEDQAQAEDRARKLFGGLYIYCCTKLETGNTRLSLNNALYILFLGYFFGVTLAFSKLLSGKSSA
jgi:hypothetical protein